MPGPVDDLGRCVGGGTSSTAMGLGLCVPWVIMLLVGAWAGVTQAKPATPPTLWEHFFVDGCKNHANSNLTRELNLKRLADTDGFFLELAIYGYNSPRLTVNRRTRCELPAGSLYRARANKTQKRTVNFTFTKVLEDDATEEEGGKNGKNEEGNDDDSGETQGEEGMKERGENGRGNTEGEEGDVITCNNLPVSESMILRNGYGFLSCREPEEKEQTVSLLRAWRKDVLEAEEEISNKKAKIMGGVGGGMALALLACVACVLVRLRSSKDAYFNPARRPSQSSQRTRVTHERGSTPHPTSSNRIGS